METVYAYYDCYPKLILAGAETEITIAALDRHCAFADGETYTVTVIPMNHITPDCWHNPAYQQLQVTGSENAIRFPIFCNEEQPYTLTVQKGEELLCALQIYGVKEDLFGLLPLRGNMHSHSFRSDGVESPELVAANYRKAGFDFLSITDHELYEPSLEAIRAFEGLDLDFKLYPGEEVHAPGNKYHIVHFAGEKSVNQLYRDQPALYEEEVRAIQKELPFGDDCDSYEYASSIWVFRKIREYGGMSILAHPHWIINGAYNIPPAIYQRFLKERPFDVLELINGGNSPYENTQTVACWHDACCQGCNVPVVGNDDSHGTVNGQWFNIGITYVLASSNSKDALMEAMREGRCIAVERYHGQDPRYYGSARLTALFSFLDRAYFPLHDEVCALEGAFMTAYLHGDPIGQQGLQLLQGRTKRLRGKYLQCK